MTQPVPPMLLPVALAPAPAEAVEPDAMAAFATALAQALQPPPAPIRPAPIPKPEEAEATEGDASGEESGDSSVMPDTAVAEPADDPRPVARPARPAAEGTGPVRSEAPVRPEPASPVARVRVAGVAVDGAPQPPARQAPRPATPGEPMAVAEAVPAPPASTTRQAPRPAAPVEPTAIAQAMSARSAPTAVVPPPASHPLPATGWTVPIDAADATSEPVVARVGHALPECAASGTRVPAAGGPVTTTAPAQPDTRVQRPAPAAPADPELIAAEPVGGAALPEVTHAAAQAIQVALASIQAPRAAPESVPSRNASDDRTDIPQMTSRPAGEEFPADPFGPQVATRTRTLPDHAMGHRGMARPFAAVTRLVETMQVGNPVAAAELEFGDASASEGQLDTMTRAPAEPVRTESPVVRSPLPRAVVVELVTGTPRDAEPLLPEPAARPATEEPKPAGAGPAAERATAAGTVDLRIGAPGPDRGSAPVGVPTGAGSLSGELDLPPQFGAPERQWVRPADPNRVSLRIELDEGVEGRLRVAVAGDRVQATIVDPRPEGARRLEGRIGELTRALEEQGFREVQVMVRTTAGRDPQAGPAWSVGVMEARDGMSGRSDRSGEDRLGRHPREHEGSGESSQGRSQQRSRRERERENG